MQNVIGVALLSFSALLSALISIYFMFFGKRSSTLYAFIYCQALIFIWSMGHIFEITAVNLSVKWIAVCIENTAICFIGFSWLLFSMLYTRNRVIKKHKVVCFLFFIPLMMYISFLTNPYHGLVYPIIQLERLQLGVLFWIHLFFVYIYLCTGILMIAGYSRKKDGLEQKQSFLLNMAVAIPLISNIFHLLNFTRLKFDITPISFSISLCLFAIATFKYRFLNTIPAALRKVFDTVEAAIILVDNEGSIISHNNAFLSAFTGFVSGHVDEFNAYLKQRMQDNHGNHPILDAITKVQEEPVFSELELVEPERLILRAAVQPVFDRKHGIIGKVLSFTDITSYRALSEELAEKNLQLTEANEQLRKHMLAVEELAVIKERNRVARDIHDTLGHTLTFLTKVQEAAILDFGKDDEKTLETMKRANEITRNGLKELRHSIHNMMPERREFHALLNDLRRLAAGFTSSGVKIEVTVDGDTDYHSQIYSEAIFRTCQEAVTNSIKHGNADEIHMMLQVNRATIRLFIIDNGSGCKEITKGYGLTGMSERISKLGGDIKFGSDGESGFNIRVEIPLRGDEGVQSNFGR